MENGLNYVDIIYNMVQRNFVMKIWKTSLKMPWGISKDCKLKKDRQYNGKKKDKKC